MLVWTSENHHQEYLHELLRLERKGSTSAQHKCSGCSVALGEGSEHHRRLTRCSDCFGSPLECVDCCLKHHLRHPLHHIEVSSLS